MRASDGVGEAASRCRPTRRELLAGAGAAAVGALGGVGDAWGQAASRAATRPASAPASQPAGPWWMGPEYPRSRVVDVRSGDVLTASVADSLALERLLDEALRKLTEAPTAAAAWRQVLGSARRIVLKFNGVGAEVINTSAAMAEVLVAGLRRAGYDPPTVALVEVPEYLRERLGSRAVPAGWGPPIAVGGRPEPLASYLYDADALINVPFLKTHQIAGMSGCLKNLSHALIRHPARYHDNGCSPYVGQVIGSQVVSSKLRLNVVNALRIVARNGPDATEDDIVPYGGLLLGFDPVAVDTVGLDLLAVERRRLGFGEEIAVPHLVSAGEAGVGRWRPGQVERVAL
jgi:hypothetical protein